MMEYRGYRNIYGYRTSTILDRHFVIDDRVASVVRQMFLWILDGKSIDEIAEYLNQQSYLTPAEYTRCNNTIMWDEEYSKRSLWDSRMVRRILRNKMYTGTLEWGYRESYYEEGKRKQRKISIIQGDSDRKFYDPIVTMDEFMKVQMILDAYSRVGKEQRKKTYTSLLTCGICGGKMKRRCASGDKKKYVYYRCTDRMENGKKIKGCSYVCVKEEFLESQLKELGLYDMERLELVEKVERIIVNQGGGIEVYMKNGMWL